MKLADESNQPNAIKPPDHEEKGDKTSFNFLIRPASNTISFHKKFSALLMVRFLLTLRSKTSLFLQFVVRICLMCVCGIVEMTFGFIETPSGRLKRLYPAEWTTFFVGASLVLIPGSFGVDVCRDRVTKIGQQIRMTNCSIWLYWVSVFAAHLLQIWLSFTVIVVIIFAFLGRSWLICHGSLVFSCFGHQRQFYSVTVLPSCLTKSTWHLWC